MGSSENPNGFVFKLLNSIHVNDGRFFLQAIRCPQHATVGWEQKRFLRFLFSQDLKREVDELGARLEPLQAAGECEPARDRKQVATPKTFVGIKMERTSLDLSDDDEDGTATQHYPEPCNQIGFINGISKLNHPWEIRNI